MAAALRDQNRHADGRYAPDDRGRAGISAAPAAPVPFPSAPPLRDSVDALDIDVCEPEESFDELLSKEMRAQWVHERERVMDLLQGLPDPIIRAWYLTKTDAGQAEFRRGLVTGAHARDELAQLEADAATVSKEQESVLRRAEAVAADRVLDFTELVSDARTSPYVATTLQKNATKQNIPEKVAHAYLSEKTGLPVLRLRDAATRLSVRFTDDGKVGVDVPATTEYSKDADFVIVVPRDDGSAHVVLASHKHAREGGGHQDNQKQDAFSFLAGASEAAAARRPIPGLADLVEHATGKPATRITWEPALILDGPYFADAAVFPDARASMQARFVGSSERFVAWVSRQRGR